MAERSSTSSSGVSDRQSVVLKFNRKNNVIETEEIKVFNWNLFVVVVVQIPLSEWDIDEEGEEGPAGKTPGSARFKTPSVRYQGVLPLSDKKTPYSNLISPSLLPSVDR